MTSAARPTLIPIDQVVSLLGAQAHRLAAELLPGGRRDGHEWRCGSLAGEPGTSMAVHLSGNKAGVWSDFASGESGDALDLVAQARFRGHKGEALTWARRWLGLDSGNPADLAQARRVAQERTDKTDEDAERTRKSAFALWLNARERIADTPVEDYLAGRGIDLASLGRQPRAIRFHPALFNVTAQARLPAMVTAIKGPDGQFAAVHRTWLEQAGPGDWRKARLDQPKKVLGQYRGGMIALWRGASGKPLRDAPIGETVDITEGIEDGLSVAVASPECRVVAAISISNMANLVFPPAVTCVRLWRQNDTEPQAIATFGRVVDSFVRRGLHVLIPPIPDAFKDVNDLLRSAAC